MLDSNNLTIGLMYPGLEGETFYQTTQLGEKNHIDTNYRPQALRTDVLGFEDAQLQTKFLEEALIKVAKGVLGQEKVVKDKKSSNESSLGDKFLRFMQAIPHILIDCSSRNTEIGTYKSYHKEIHHHNDKNSQNASQNENELNWKLIGAGFVIIGGIFAYILGGEAGALKNTGRQQKKLENLITIWNTNKEKFYNAQSIFATRLQSAVEMGTSILDQQKFNQKIRVITAAAMVGIAVLGLGACMIGSVAAVKVLVAASVGGFMVILFRVAYERSMLSSQEEDAREILVNAKSNAAALDNKPYTLPSYNPESFEFLGVHGNPTAPPQD